MTRAPDDSRSWAPWQRYLPHLCDVAQADVTDDDLGSDLLLAVLSAAEFSLTKAGQLDQVINVLESALADRTSSLSHRHPATLITADNLAHAYRLAGQLDDAVVLGHEAVNDLITSLALDHPDTLWARQNLARRWPADHTNWA